MARQTRDERRKRRELAGAPAPTRSRREVTRAVAETAPVAAPPGQRGGFVGESIAELRKVEWPNQKQVIQGTVVVLIACLVVGVYLYLNDKVWQQVVSKVFLGQ